MFAKSVVQYQQHGIYSFTILVTWYLSAQFTSVCPLQFISSQTDPYPSFPYTAVFNLLYVNLHFMITTSRLFHVLSLQ